MCIFSTAVRADQVPSVESAKRHYDKHLTELLIIQMMAGGNLKRCQLPTVDKQKNTRAIVDYINATPDLRGLPVDALSDYINVIHAELAAEMIVSRSCDEWKRSAEANGVAAPESKAPLPSFNPPKASELSPIPTPPRALTNLAGKSTNYESGYLFGYINGAGNVCPSVVEEKDMNILKLAQRAVLKLHEQHWLQKGFRDGESDGRIDAVRLIAENGGSLGGGLTPYCAEVIEIAKYKHAQTKKKGR